MNDEMNTNTAADPDVKPDQPKSFGIQDTKELITFICAMTRGIQYAQADGKWNYMDAAHFMDPLTTLPAAFSGIHNIPSEISDIDDAEMDEMKQHIIQKFDLIDEDMDAVEEWIEDAVIAVISLVSVASKAKKVFRPDAE